MKIVKVRSQVLPDDVAPDLLALRRLESNHPFRAYLSALVQAGWRLTAIAAVLAVSRERVRQYVIHEDYVTQSVEEYRLILGMALPLPPGPTRAYSSGGGRRGPKLKEFCLRGHPRSGENLYISAKGNRCCRACNRERARKDYLRRAAPRG